MLTATTHEPASETSKRRIRRGRRLGGALFLAVATWVPSPPAASAPQGVSGLPAAASAGGPEAYEAAAGAAGATSADRPHGELHLRRTEPRATGNGLLHAADALQPGLVTPPASQWTAMAELAATWRAHGPGASRLPLALGLRARAEATRTDGAGTGSRIVPEELHLSADAGAWQLSAGRKVVSWDVGFAFRPNDVVQQEQRRTLVAEPLVGHPLVMAEVFGAETAWALVRVNPNHQGDAALDAREDLEAAWAARGYRRLGALDAHVFARDGDRTGASMGAALAWVAGDSLALHASLRRMRRHEGWAIDPAAGLAPLRADPYRWASDGRATQALAGLQWTGEHRQGVLVEAWFDGTAPSRAQWQAWRARNEALVAAAAPGVPAAMLAGNLAWQTRQLDRRGLVRQNVFVRLSLRPGADEAWEVALDTLYAPEDRGRIHTLNVGWQGDRFRLALALRCMEGPSAAVFRQVPVRTTGVIDASWSF